MRNNTLFLFVIIYGSITFVASAITGLIAGVSFGTLLFRAIMFFVLGAGIFYGTMKILAVLFNDISGSTHEHSDTERVPAQEGAHTVDSPGAESTGTHVNIVLDDTHEASVSANTNVGNEGSVDQGEHTPAPQESDDNEKKDMSIHSPFSDEKITYNTYNDDKTPSESAKKDVSDDVTSDNFSELITEQGLHNIPKVEKSETIITSSAKGHTNGKDLQGNVQKDSNPTALTHKSTDMKTKSMLGSTKPIRNQVLDVEIEKVSHQYKKSPEIFTKAVATLMKKDDNS